MVTTKRIIATLLTALFTTVSQAEVRLPSIIGSHMVVQQGMEVPIWGWAEPGEDVTVAMSGQTATATTVESGEWRVPIECGIGRTTSSSTAIASWFAARK